MSQEIRLTVSLAIAKGYGSASVARTVVIDQTGVETLSNVQTIGTSWEALVLGDIATIGHLAAVNEDETNFIQLATANDDSGIFAKLLPGRPCYVPIPTATIYAKADTAACPLRLLAGEL